MTRGTKCRSAVAWILLAAATAAWPAAAGAAPPAAIEEYVLTLPGVDTSDVGRPEPLADLSQRAGPVGVVGEQRDAGTRLSAIGEVVPTAGGLALLAALGAGTLLAVRRRGSR